jgi:hypothetical protein
MLVDWHNHQVVITAVAGAVLAKLGKIAFPTSVPGYVYPKAGDGGNGTCHYAAWTTATSTGDDGGYYAGGGVWLMVITDASH